MLQRFDGVKIITIVPGSVLYGRGRAETLTPIMMNLSSEKLASKALSFSTTVFQYFRTFFLSVKRFTEGCWGFPLTCFTTPAVYCGVVPSMDTSSCLKEIERVCTRYGIPSVVWSENKTHFESAKKNFC